MNEPDVMVYLMTGFLDSGKTGFLKFTLKQDYFQIDGKTLLILCEDGEDEYDAMEMLRYGVVIERLEDREELTEEYLAELDRKHEPDRVVIEYNGMWKVSDFENMKLPKGWGIEQKITTVDASTFQTYLTNLKPLFVEMVRGAEMVLFNRCEDIKPLAGYRRSVKVVSPQAEVIFEDEQGEVENIFEDDVPYDLDAPYACLSIKMNGTSGMPFSLKEDLAALPGVEDVSAAINLTDTYSITSDKIRSSQMLSDIRVKDNGFYTGVPNLMHNASNGTLNTFVCALPDDELERIAEDADVPENSMDALLAGDSVLLRWGDCYYDPAADEYYQGFQPDGSTLAEPVFSAGDKLSIQYQRYTGQDEAGNDVYQTYAAELPIAGIVKSTADYTLLTTDRIFYNGTVFVSTALYHKMFEGAGSYFMEKEGYSSLNVKLAAGNNFSLRRPIASIATRRNGILSADNYDLLSQSYTEGTQSAFLVGILAVLGVLLGCALLVVLNLSAYEVQQQRLSLLLTLGVSPKKLVCSYAKRVIPVIVGTTLIVNILVSVAVSHIVPIQSILDLIRIHTDGRVFEFHRPVGSQILVSILLMGFWLGAALLPVFSFIRKKASKGDIL